MFPPARGINWQRNSIRLVVSGLSLVAARQRRHTFESKGFSSQGVVARSIRINAQPVPSPFNMLAPLSYCARCLFTSKRVPPFSITPPTPFSSRCRTLSPFPPFCLLIPASIPTGPEVCREEYPPSNPSSFIKYKQFHTFHSQRPTSTLGRVASSLRRGTLDFVKNSSGPLPFTPFTISRSATVSVPYIRDA